MKTYAEQLQQGYEEQLGRANRLRAALEELADEAARAVCEPRRFMENDESRQQKLSHALTNARMLLRVD